jgi:hypothetical protein
MGSLAIVIVVAIIVNEPDSSQKYSQGKYITHYPSGTRIDDLPQQWTHH